MASARTLYATPSCFIRPCLFFAGGKLGRAPGSFPDRAFALDSRAPSLCGEQTILGQRGQSLPTLRRTPHTSACQAARARCTSPCCMAHLVFAPRFPDSLNDLRPSLFSVLLGYQLRAPDCQPSALRTTQHAGTYGAIFMCIHLRGLLRRP